MLSSFHVFVVTQNKMLGKNHTHSYFYAHICSYMSYTTSVYQQQLCAHLPHFFPRDFCVQNHTASFKCATRTQTFDPVLEEIDVATEAISNTHFL